MTANTKIEWADHTFNPWIGCTRVSEAAHGGGGCDNCYAAVSTPARALRVVWGHGKARYRTSLRTWTDPIRWNSAHTSFLAAYGRRQRVFCASLADVFDNEVPDAWRADLFDLIWNTPHLDWLLLTKRIGNASPMIARALELAGLGMCTPWPWSNVWLGATVVNQAEANRDIPKLLNTSARVRFLSMEPLLGAVDLSAIPISGHGHHEFDPIITANVLKRPIQWPTLPKVDWVIAGGESGPDARPMHPEWARSLRDQCAQAGVPFHFKQWGEFIPADHFDCDPGIAPSRLQWSDGAGYSDEDGQRGGVELMARVGKKASGRVLDGNFHAEFPS